MIRRGPYGPSITSWSPMTDARIVSISGDLGSRASTPPLWHGSRVASSPSWRSRLGLAQPREELEQCGRRDRERGPVRVRQIAVRVARGWDRGLSGDDAVEQALDQARAALVEGVPEREVGLVDVGDARAVGMGEGLCRAAGDRRRAEVVLHEPSPEVADGPAAARLDLPGG